MGLREAGRICWSVILASVAICTILAMVKGGKIEGWMEAMTMEYPVKDPQEFSKLKVGANIQAKITVQGTDYWISSVNPEPAK